MKKTLTLLFFISIAYIGFAQSFLLTDPKGNPYSDGQTITATITEEDLDFFGQFVTDIIVENLTVTELNIRTSRINVSLPDKIRAWVCFGMCYDDDELNISNTIMSSSDIFSLHLAPVDTLEQCHYGLCKFQLSFSSETDNMTLYVEIAIQPVGIKENSGAAVSLSAFPNPASAHSKINISYTLSNNNYDSYLVIRNIMGAKVFSLPLNPYENSLAIEASTFIQGVYFYTIENKNNVSIAKKLVVK